MGLNPDKIQPSFITDGKAHWDDPWCLVLHRTNQGEMWTEVVKANVQDPTSKYASWMTKQWHGNPTGDDKDRWDGGDVYCRLILGGHLYQVQGREPTEDERLEWARLRLAALKHPDPFDAIFGGN